MATLLGFFVGMKADDQPDIEVGVAIYADHIRDAADVVMEYKDGPRS